MPISQTPHADLQIEIRQTHQLWIRLDNPAQRNALTIAMIESLTKILAEADADPVIRVIVLTGAGDHFCAGGDIKAMKNRIGMFAGESDELRRRYMQGIQKIPRAIESLSKPVIAMINGAAIGAGCDLAMMCDLRIGSEKSKFAETFTKLGLVPGDGGTFFLVRAIGYAKAMRMFLTGDAWSGQEALNFGLLQEIHPSESLEKATEALTSKIAANAPVAIQMTKKALKLASVQTLDSSLDLLAAFQGIAQRTDDHFEALEGFEAKRPPNFQGK